MKFVIVGAGGVGGYLGARLGQAGHELAWLARGPTISALRGRGLLLVSPSGTERLGPQRASDDAATLAHEFGSPAAVIVSVKLYDLAALAPRLAPLAGPGTPVLPLQNGVEAPSILSAVLPQVPVLMGTVSIKSVARAPGDIVCKSDFCKIRVGGGTGPEIDALVAALNGCKAVTATVSADIELDLWSKFVMLGDGATRAGLQHNQSDEHHGGSAADSGHEGLASPKIVDLLIGSQKLRAPKRFYTTKTRSRHHVCAARAEIDPDRT